MKRLWTIAGAALFAAACSGTSGALTHGEGVDAATLPAGVREDYAVFADRCSKCHSLARAFNSGVQEDSFWVHYVARMRRQPGSGITAVDEAVILRFLHYYSEELRKKKGGASETPMVGSR